MSDEPRTYFKVRSDQGEWLIVHSLSEIEDHITEDVEEFEIASVIMRPSEYSKLDEWGGW